jgi:hypothetical protein
MTKRDRRINGIVMALAGLALFFMAAVAMTP